MVGTEEEHLADEKYEERVSYFLGLLSSENQGDRWRAIEALARTGDERAIEPLIAAADVFVMSSKEEGLGSVILNALALERPVVATMAGGIPEILPPEALVPVGGAAALAEKVVAALRERVPVPFPAGFTATAMAHGVLDVYRALL